MFLFLLHVCAEFYFLLHHYKYVVDLFSLFCSVEYFLYILLNQT